jgi:hypothetical protein
LGNFNKKIGQIVVIRMASFAKSGMAFELLLGVNFWIGCDSWKGFFCHFVLQLLLGLYLSSALSVSLDLKRKSELFSVVSPQKELTSTFIKTRVPGIASSRKYGSLSEFPLEGGMYEAAYFLVQTKSLFETDWTGNISWNSFPNIYGRRGYRQHTAGYHW